MITRVRLDIYKTTTIRKANKDSNRISRTLQGSTDDEDLEEHWDTFKEDDD